MHGSRHLALMFLFGALLIGGALGFSATRVLERERGCGRKDARGMRESLARDLQLTAAQRVAIDTILDVKHREMSAIMAPVRPRLDAVSDTARQQISRLLDERQRARFQEMHFKRKLKTQKPGERR